LTPSVAVDDQRAQTAPTPGEIASGAVTDVRNLPLNRLINNVPFLAGHAADLLSNPIKLRLETKACPHRQAQNVSGYAH
jgi:hypothetical protein